MENKKHDELLKKYQQYFVWGEKNGRELREIVKAHINIIPVNFEELTAAEQKNVVLGALHRARIKGDRTDPQEVFKALQMECFEVLQDKRSETYYQQPISAVSHTKRNSIFIVLENKTGFVASNSFKLATWLEIQRGIDEKNVIAQDKVLLEYLASQHLYWDDGD